MAAAPRTDLDVGRLRVLREVGARGSIAAAARSLGLTSSAVSQQISTLEREVGVSLVDRSSRGAVLTGAGAMLSARAEEVLSVLAGARADLEALSGHSGGRVRVASVASAAATLVSAAVAGLPAEVEVWVLGAEPAHALELLARDDVDVVIVDEYDLVPLPVPDRLAVTPLYEERLVLLTAPGLVATGGLALSSLARQDWVIPPDTAACGLAVRLACRAAGFEPRVRWETDDMWLLVQAVAAGHGVAVLAPLTVVGAAGEVDVVELTRPVLHRRLTALARPSAQARPAVAAVLAALVEAASDRAAS